MDTCTPLLAIVNVAVNMHAQILFKSLNKVSILLGNILKWNYWINTVILFGILSKVLDFFLLSNNISLYGYITFYLLIY